jgi:AcrR family transcriptional regulator
VTSSTLPADPVTADDTRARVLEVALELFAEQGFAATSTRELSERLGFTKAALYYYFRTKDDLLTALVQPVLDDLTALVARSVLQPSPAARRDLLAAYIDISTHHLDLLRVLTQDPSIARRPVSTTHTALFGRLLALLVGHDDPDARERTRARAALGAIRAGLLRGDPDDDPGVIAAATLAAACGALGIPGPRQPEGHG